MADDNEGDRAVVADWVRPGHETLLGLLGVYLIFFLIFWYLLVARPFGTSRARGVTAAATTPASVGVSPSLRMAGNQATLGTLSATTQSSVRATVVSDWNHAASGAGP